MGGGEENEKGRDGKKNGKKKKKQAGPSGGIGEAAEISINVQLRNFIKSDFTELKFSSFLSSTERLYIHLLAKKMGLKSKSREKGIFYSLINKTQFIISLIDF